MIFITFFFVYEKRRRLVDLAQPPTSKNFDIPDIDACWTRFYEIQFLSQNDPLCKVSDLFIVDFYHFCVILDYVWE